MISVTIDDDAYRFAHRFLHPNPAMTEQVHPIETRSFVASTAPADNGRRIVVIGAGIARLCAAVYAQ